jgi:hypothetical protein
VIGCGNENLRRKTSQRSMGASTSAFSQRINVICRERGVPWRRRTTQPQP